MWKQIIKDQESSGLSQKAYCEKNNIKPGTFSKSKMKLKQKPKIDKSSLNQQVSWVLGEYTSNIDTLKEKPLTVESIIVIEINNFKISVAKNFNKKLFLEVCEVLRQLC